MRWTGHRGDSEAVSQNRPGPTRQRGLVGTSRPQTVPLTCEAEPQHSQCGGHTHTRAARSTQHLPVRQLTAGLSVMEGCPCLWGRRSEASVSEGPYQALSLTSSPLDQPGGRLQQPTGRCSFPHPTGLPIEGYFERCWQEEIESLGRLDQGRQGSRQLGSTPSKILICKQKIGEVRPRIVKPGLLRATQVCTQISLAQLVEENKT